MAFEIIGKLIEKYDIVQRTETFKIREFVIEVTDEFGGRQISNYIKFQCTQDRTALPDRFNLGDEVKVHFNLRGTKWVKDGKESYFTNLDAWRIEQVKIGAENVDNPAGNSNENRPSEVIDDLPF